MSDCRWGVKPYKHRPELVEYDQTEPIRCEVVFEPDDDGYELVPKQVTMMRSYVDGKLRVRRVKFVKVDGMTFKPERTCTMTRAYVGEPCSDFTCSECGKMQCVPNGMHRLVPSVHCQRCGARVTRLVDQDGNELPMHDG